MTDQRTPCPHCPDGHDDPNRKPWAVYVGAECDGDGQPINLRVGPSNCSHVAESDAEWLRGVIRAAKPQRSDSHDNGAAASARRIADELTGRIDAIMRESADAHEAGDARLGTTLGFLAAVLDDLRAVLAENETMRHTIAAVRTLAEKWGGEPTSVERFLANAILAIVVEPTPGSDEPWPDEPLSWRWWRKPTENCAGAMACNSCGTGVVVFEDYTSDRIYCMRCGRKGRNGPPTPAPPRHDSPGCAPAGGRCTCGAG